MFFVTDEPKLFNVETGTCTVIEVSEIVDDVFNVKVFNYLEEIVFSGTYKECEDFIYSIAGYVGAVNPVGKVNKYDETEDKILLSILDGMP